MKKMKKLIAIALMALVLGVAAPAAFADGPSEMTGISGPSELPGNDGPSETTGIDDGCGVDDGCGRAMLDILVFLATNLVA
jgi:hypothetical protein